MHIQFWMNAGIEFCLHYLSLQTRYDGQYVSKIVKMIPEYTFLRYHRYPSLSTMAEEKPILTITDSPVINLTLKG